MPDEIDILHFFDEHSAFGNEYVTLVVVVHASCVVPRMVVESYLATSTSQDLEPLPKGCSIPNVLHGILYQQPIPNGVIYHGGNNIHEPNNEIASRLTGFHIKGDVVLKVETDALFERKPLKGYVKRVEGSRYSWENLPQEILGLIIEFLDCSAAITGTLSQVCVSWREKIINDAYIMEKVQFRTLALRKDTNGIQESNNFPPPEMHRVLNAALLSNNITACIVMARYLTNKRHFNLARRYWKIASKRCHPEGLAVLGFEFYSDRYLVERDPEEAYLLLSRACKRLETSLMTGNTPVLMTEDSCRKLLQRAAHVLAILIMDNDFLSPIERDTTGAVKWLKTSHRLGCQEAGKLLQSMFRSGQY